MEDYIERLQIEKAQLQERIAKLDAYMLSDEFTSTVSEGEQDMMTKQRVAMLAYLDVLTNRIALSI
jgi:alkylhydroperoxidase family enzyme